MRRRSEGAGGPLAAGGIRTLARSGMRSRGVRRGGEVGGRSEKPPDHVNLSDMQATFRNSRYCHRSLMEGIHFSSVDVLE